MCSTSFLAGLLVEIQDKAILRVILGRTPLAAHPFFVHPFPLLHLLSQVRMVLVPLGDVSGSPSENCLRQSGSRAGGAGKSPLPLLVVL